MMGALRNQIELLQPTVTQLPSGQQQRSYPASGVQQMAEVTSGSGTERTRDDQIEAIQLTTFRIRYPHQEPTPDVRWRISHRNKIYEIDAVQDRDGRQRWMHLVCKSVG